MQSKTAIFVVLLAIAALSPAGFISSGDAGSDPTRLTIASLANGMASAGNTPANLAPDAQQVLRLNVGSEPNTLDPQATSYSYESTVVKNAFVTLFDQDPQTSQLTPLAAAEVPTTLNGGISADGLTYTIPLKAGLVWSDSTSLTAQDFVYGIIRGFNLKISGAAYGGFITQIQGASDVYALDPASPTYAAEIQSRLQDSVVAVDSTTIKIVLAFPSNEFLSNLVLPITAAVKQSNIDALGAAFGKSAGAAEMVTSGPFTISQWTPGDHIRMARNDNYAAGHQAYLRELDVYFIADVNTAYYAFQAGQLDEAALPVSVDASTEPNVKQENEFGTRWIAVDVTLPPWNNKDFVIGINQATDRDTLVRDVYGGQRIAWASPCAPGVVGCDPSIFSNLEYNLANAQASIARAYPNGNIPPVTLETVGDPGVLSLVTELQSQWAQVGVTVNINITDQATLRADMKNHISGTQITGWGMDVADPTDLWSTLTTSQVGANNLGFYSRPEFDQLVAEQDQAADPAQRQQLLTQIQQFYASDPADITFALRLRTDAFGANVKGLISSPFDFQIYGDQSLSAVYIAQAPATLTAPANAGATEIQVSSDAGFSLGDHIVINPGGANQEANQVAGFGSIQLMTPLVHDHQAGELVVRLIAGDVDCSGDVSVVDVTSILRFVIGLTPSATCVLAVGDMNCDSSITALDALDIMRYAATLPQLTSVCP